MIHIEIIIGLLFVLTQNGNVSIVLHVLQLQKLKNMFVQQQWMEMHQMVLNQIAILSVWMFKREYTRLEIDRS